MAWWIALECMSIFFWILSIIWCTFIRIYVTFCDNLLMIWSKFARYMLVTRRDGVGNQEVVFSSKNGFTMLTNSVRNSHLVHLGIQWFAMVTYTMVGIQPAKSCPLFFIIQYQPVVYHLWQIQHWPSSIGSGRKILGVASSFWWLLTAHEINSDEEFDNTESLTF